MEKRQTLVLELVDCLSGEPSVGMDNSWLEEIKRRQREVEDGTVDLIPREQFMQEIRQEFGW